MTLEHMRRFIQRTQLRKAIMLYEKADLDYGRIDDPAKFRKEKAKYEQYIASTKTLKQPDLEILNSYISGKDSETCLKYKVLSTCTTIEQFKEHSKTQRELIQYFAAVEEVTFFQASKIVTRVLDIETSLIKYCKTDADSIDGERSFNRLKNYIVDYFNLFHKKDLGLPFLSQVISELTLVGDVLNVKHSITKHIDRPPYDKQNWRCDVQVNL